MKLFCTICFLLFISNANAQDSVIQYRSYSSELKTSSQKTQEDKYFNYVTLRMQEGDGVLIIYKSKDYITELVVQDSIGSSSKTDDNGNHFNSTGSKIIIPFMSDSPNFYYIAFSSKEHNKTGKFNAKIIHYIHSADKTTDNSPFCDKLSYIIDHSQYNFEFMKKGKEQGTYAKIAPALDLISGKECSIKGGSDPSYNCTVYKTTNKAEAEKVYKETDSIINTCLKGYYRNATGGNEPEVVYRFEGSNDNDINSRHALINVKAEAFLKMHKEGNTYYVEIIID